MARPWMKLRRHSSAVVSLALFLRLPPCGCLCSFCGTSYETAPRPHPHEHRGLAVSTPRARATRGARATRATLGVRGRLGACLAACTRNGPLITVREEIVIFIVGYLLFLIGVFVALAF